MERNERIKGKIVPNDERKQRRRGRKRRAKGKLSQWKMSNVWKVLQNDVLQSTMQKTRNV